MDGLLNANEIAEKISFYENLSLILIILAIVFAIISIVLFFVLKVSRSIRVLSGMGVDKEIRKISEDTQLGNSYSKQSHSKAALNWTTSDMRNPNPATEETQLLDDANGTYAGDETQLLVEDPDATTILGAASDATTVLGTNVDADATTVLGADTDFDATTVLSNTDPDATTVLSETAQNVGFEIEEEIVITGNQSKGI
jgi:hypothetical protein